MLIGTIGFVGVVIIIFGIVQIFQGQRIPGMLITAIGIIDLIGLYWLSKKL